MNENENDVNNNNNLGEFTSDEVLAFVMAAHKSEAGETSSSSVDLNLSLGGEGTSSGVERGGKRPKIGSFAMDWDSLFPSAPSLESRPISVTERMPSSLGHYVCSISDDDGSLFVSDSSRMEVDENVSQEMDDQENQMDLTDDLLHLVLSFLDHDNLCRAARVCRQWRVASAHEDFWKSLNFENKKISPKQFEDMCQRYPNATQVNIIGTPDIHALAMQAISSLRNLELLTLGKGQLGVTFFEALTDCTTLKSLIVTDAILGNEIQEIAIIHVSLTRIQIVKCRMLGVYVRCPQLQALSLKRSSMAHVALDCPLLRDLDIASCHELLDAAIRSAVMSCRLLESLDMSDCCVNDETLREISSTCGNLHILNASYCPNISLESVRLPMLTVLKLHSCESLTNSICEVFSDGGGCPMLKSLILDNCESLTAVAFSSESLTSLSLADCRAITSLQLACPNLEQVSLDGCDHLERATFSPVGLQSLNLGICPKLNVLEIEAPTMVLLELRGCGVLSEALINCPLLTSLDASFCSQLKDDCLSATTASSPLIESLILMSCRSVGSDGLLSLSRLLNLTSLDLSYTFLTDLQPVFDSCLQLKVLKLQACKYLTDMSLEPLYKDGALPTLRELDLSYGSLCQAFIEELLACCTHLTHVNLNGCVNMHDLNSSFSVAHRYLSTMPSEDDPPACHAEQPQRFLQYLNCVGCPNIKKVLIPSAAHFSHLLSLNLSLSVNLKEVDVACMNLCFLNLSNCSSLEILKLDCPRLTSLFLQSCIISEEAVEFAISQCNMLESLDVRFCQKITPKSMGRLRTACPSLKHIFTASRTNSQLITNIPKR